MQARLVTRGPARVYEVPPSGLVVGSSASATLPDTDASVQRRHCRIAIEAGALYVEDLNSASGTFLNGVRVDGRARLVHGDVLRCGTSMLELVCDLAGRSPDGGEEDPPGRPREVRELEARAERLERELRELRAAVAALEAERRELRARLEEASRRVTHGREREEQLRSEIAAAAADARRTREVLAREREDSDRAREEANKLIGELQLIIHELQARKEPG